MADAELKLAWALRVCARVKVRLTPIRQKILAFLTTQRLPVCLAAVMQVEDIRGECNPSTVYRNLMLLSKSEVVRQVNIASKTRYFILNIPGENGCFLICQTCAKISVLSPAESVTTLEHEIALTHNYTCLRHELIFLGLCPACQTASPDSSRSKLQAGEEFQK